MFCALTMDPNIERILQHAGQKCGYEQLKDTQMSIIQHILKGDDCLCVSPTGSGKSCVFEVAPFAKGMLHLGTWMSVVVSPLVSLMETQARELNSRDIPAIYLNAMEDTNTDVPLAPVCEEEVLSGKFKVLLASPESLLGTYRELIGKLSGRLCGLFIDEAHCVKKLLVYHTVLLNLTKL